jgi:hypothetical protein
VIPGVPKGWIVPKSRLLFSFNSPVSRPGESASLSVQTRALGRITHAERVVSYEGDRAFPTTGKAGFVHPYQEAPEAERRLRAEAAPVFDEFLVLRFKASNAPPFPFEWVSYEETRLD